MGAGNNVVEIELLPWQAPAAVLAGAFITGINVIPAKAHLPLRYAVVAHQQDDPRYADHPIDQTDGFVVRRNRQVAPAGEIKGLILLVDRHEAAMARNDSGRGEIDIGGVALSSGANEQAVA